jgi:signal transduction histidine kinase
MRKPGRQALLSWGFVSILFLLCGTLGFLQYRWIGEVSLAERDRLGQSLQATLDGLGQDFDAEIAGAYRALAAPGFEIETDSIEASLGARYKQWAQTARHAGIVRRIAVARWRTGSIALRMLDPRKGVLAAAGWPQGWSGLKTSMESYRPEGPPAMEGPPGSPGPPWNQSALASGDAAIFVAPLPVPGPPEDGPFEPREMAWLLVELDTRYIGEVMLPEVVRRHLGPVASLDYQVAVLTRTNPPAVVYQSDPGQGLRIAANADARASLLRPQLEGAFRGMGPGRGPGRGMGRGPGPGRGMGRGPGPPREAQPGRGPRVEPAMWDLFARHRAGSLEAVVSRTRRRNLAVTAGVLLLLAATLAALLRYTRRAQRLAQLQMEFVAGVSHELRTPLTVIHTAAYNLQGKLAANPAQVERYGALIQRESGRLKELVEQALQFAGAQAGRMVQQLDPLSMEAVIDEAVEASRAAIEASGCVFEKEIQAGLPPVLGDPVALPRALHNLLANAAKYGAEGKWIGLSASIVGEGREAMVEIRVADRGPGIPKEEQKRVFDPFFRGRRAVQDQVHGAGLGLNLARGIVEAHGGVITVKSQPMKGTEFTIRLPLAPGGSET